ncbi:MAG: class I SAM-dependent methyltransferase [Gemmatimonadaceae bacterium]
MPGFLRQTRDRALADIQPDSGIELLWRPFALPTAVLDAMPTGTTNWPISPELGLLLARAVLRLGRRNVLEFGAGSSSLVFARALAAAGGGRLTSIESTPEWCAGQWRKVAELPTVDARLLEAQPRLALSSCGPAFSYRSATRLLASRGPYDFVLVDAPQHFFGRDGAIPLVHRFVAPGTLIVLDDAAREGERYAVARWLRCFTGLRLVAFDAAFGGRGIAILRVDAPLRSRTDWWSWCTASIHLLRGQTARSDFERTKIGTITT